MLDTGGVGKVDIDYVVMLCQAPDDSPAHKPAPAGNDDFHPLRARVTSTAVFPNTAIGRMT